MTDEAQEPFEQRVAWLLAKAAFFDTPGTNRALGRLLAALEDSGAKEGEQVRAYSELAGMLRLPTRENWESVTGRPLPGNWQQLRNLWLEMGFPVDTPVAPGAGTILSGEWCPRDVADVILAHCESKSPADLDPRRFAPKELSKKFGMCWKNLKPKLEGGLNAEIPNVKHSTKCYQIVRGHLPK